MFGMNQSHFISFSVIIIYYCICNNYLLQQLKPDLNVALKVFIYFTFEIFLLLLGLTKAWLIIQNVAKDFASLTNSTAFSHIDF